MAWFFAFWLVPAVQGQIAVAEAMEKDGRLEEALAIYGKLLREDSSNVQAIAGAKRMFKTMGRNVERISLIQYELRHRPDAAVLLAELADAQFRAGFVQDADKSTDKLVSFGQFEAAAQVLIENSQLDKALSVYQIGRKESGDPTRFFSEVVRVLVYLEAYDRATSEVLSQFDARKLSTEQARDQILRFPDDRESSVQIASTLQRYLEVRSDVYGIHRLYYELLFRLEKYDEAFRVVKLLDDRFKKQGAEVLLFAGEAFERSAYNHAMAAYRHFLTLQSQAPQAEMGVARCLEFLYRGESAGSTIMGPAKVPESPASDPAVEAYRLIVQKYPRSVWSAEACFRAGTIMLERYADIDGAMEWFQRVRIEFPLSAYRIEAAFAIADCHLGKNQLKEAGMVYATIVAELRKGPVAERAVYRQAELLFLEQKLDSASILLKAIVKRSDGLYTNDAFSLLLLLQENHKSRDLLAIYSRAALLARQKRAGEALSVLTGFIQTHPKAALVDDALLLVGDLHVAMAEPEKGIEVWRNIVDYFKESPVADLALKRIADTYDQKLRNIDEAVKAYRELLYRFPDSIYTTPARKRLRELEQRRPSSS